jgi:hypothetical protein
MHLQTSWSRALATHAAHALASSDLQHCATAYAGGAPRPDHDASA